MDTMPDMWKYFDKERNVFNNITSTALINKLVVHIVKVEKGYEIESRNPGTREAVV